MNVLFLTPLPGTRLWKQLKAEGRIAMGAFPEDWKYYTLNFPVARYKYLSPDQIIHEMNECNRTFYSGTNILSRLRRNLLLGRNPLFCLVGNLTSRRNSMLFARVYEALWPAGAPPEATEPPPKPHLDALLDAWEAGTQQLRRLTAAFRLRAGWFFRWS
jgi:hypothetical protein